MLGHLPRLRLSSSSLLLHLVHTHETKLPKREKGGDGSLPYRAHDDPQRRVVVALIGGSCRRITTTNTMKEIKTKRKMHRVREGRQRDPAGFSLKNTTTTKKKDDDLIPSGMYGTDLLLLHSVTLFVSFSPFSFIITIFLFYRKLRAQRRQLVVIGADGHSRRTQMWTDGLTRRFHDY